MKSSIILLFTFLITSTAIAQWQKQISGTSEDLNDIVALNQSTAIVVGSNGIIIKTTDNGLNWVSKNSSTLNNLNAVSFRDSINGIAVGNRVICRTSDEGESWYATSFDDNFISISYRCPFWGIPILIGSNNGKILFSNDDGNTWGDTLLFPNEPLIAVGFNYYTPNLHSPEALVATTFYTGTTFSPLSHWNLYDNPINPVWDVLTGGEFYDESNYLIGWYGNPGPVPLLLKTDSDTALWKTIYSFVPSPYIPEDIINIEGILFICGSDGKIFKSLDSGNNWIEQNKATNEYLFAISFYNNLIGYSVGKNGTILYTSNGGINSVDEEDVISSYKLFQNYPNPFNPSTIIKYALPFDSKVLIKIYNVLGQDVKLLKDEIISAGNYEVQFNSASLPSGVYFYRLSTESVDRKQKYSSIKKMILLK